MRMTKEQTVQVAEQREEQHQTRRVTVPALEQLLYTPMPVLDHGFVRVVDYMGDDSAVVQAARVSYGRGTRTPSGDAALISYLMRHRHSTPFEMCEIKYHVKLPTFVARQWIRHRMASVNEYSARYSVLDREFYIPTAEQLAAQSSSNRQGRGEVLPPDEAQRVLDLLKRDANQCFDTYDHLLNEEGDPNRTPLARELARTGLPLSTYTQWYWKVDLHNLMNFLSLRADSHAQYEIRVYAEAMMEILKTWVPKTYLAFIEHRLKAHTFSGRAMDALRLMLKGESVTREGACLSEREWQDFQHALYPSNA
jgi:thymidylate synthase (FAD)